MKPRQWTYWFVFYCGIIAAGILILLVGTARAVTWSEDQVLAERYWGGQPPCGIVRFEPLPVTERPGVAARAYPGRCLIRMRSPQTMTMTEQCYIVVHENGHLWGLQHSWDPTSIMFHELTPSQWLGLCERQFHEITGKWHPKPV